MTGGSNNTTAISSAEASFALKLRQIRIEEQGNLFFFSFPTFCSFFMKEPLQRREILRSCCFGLSLSLHADLLYFIAFSAGPKFNSSKDQPFEPYYRHAYSSDCSPHALSICKISKFATIAKSRYMLPE